MAILVGFDEGVVKKDGPNKGKRFKIFHIVQDNVGINTVGQSVESVFCFNEDIMNKVTDKFINKKVELLYNISNGRAYLKDVELIQ